MRDRADRHALFGTDNGSDLRRPCTGWLANPLIAWIARTAPAGRGTPGQTQPRLNSGRSNQGQTQCRAPAGTSYRRRQIAIKSPSRPRVGAASAAVVGQQHASWTRHAHDRSWPDTCRTSCSARRVEACQKETSRGAASNRGELGREARWEELYGRGDPAICGRSKKRGTRAPLRSVTAACHHCDNDNLATSNAMARKDRRSSAPSSALKNLSGLEAHCCKV
jgi:hypothetical protein